MSIDQAPLQWLRSLQPPYYVNSVAISSDGGIVVAGTFYHVYSDERKAGATGEDGTFGTYCFDRTGKLLWQDTFKGWQGVYWVAVSRDGTVAASGGWASRSPYAGFVSAYSVAPYAKTLQFATDARVNALALDEHGAFLVAASDALYLFRRSGSVFDPTPAKLALADGNTAETVAMSSDGAWIVYGDYQGNVVLVENQSGAFGQRYAWSLPGGGTIHCVTMSDDGEWIAVGASGGTLYVLSRARLIAGQGCAWSYPFSEGGSVYFAAVAGDGGVVSAVVNDGDAGAVYVFTNSDDAGTLLWRQTTPRNPNSTSMDRAAQYVAVADGHPDGTPGHFLLFDRASGQQLWEYTTGNMSWPMFLAAGGSAIAAGSDDSTVYYFTPA